MGQNNSKKLGAPQKLARKGLHFEALEPRILFDASGGSAPTAEVSVTTGELTVNEDQFLNDNIEFQITFDNNGGQEGYVPYVDFLGLPEMVIENVSAFGSALDNPGGSGTQPIGVIAANGELVGIGTGLPVDHPMYASSIGVPSSDFFGGAGSGTEPVTYDPSFAGYYVYSVQLPFGSFTPGNPPAEITVEASLNDSDNVIPSTDYALHARGGFALGCDPLDNPGTVLTPDDEPVFGSFASATAHPVVMNLVKSAGVAEREGLYIGENVTGPNFPITYRLEVDVATGETVNNILLTDLLPDDLAYLGNLTVTDGAGGVIPFTILSQPTPASDLISGVPASGNSLEINFPSVTGAAGSDIIVTYDVFIPYAEEGGDLVVNATTGQEGDLDEYNDARVTGDWTSNGGATVVVGDNAGPANGGDPDGVLGERETDYIIDEHSIAIQKGVAFAPDSGSGGGDRAATGWSEGDVAAFTMNFQISDYFAFDNVVVNDVMSDGLEFLPALDPLSAWANAGDFDTDALEIRPVLTFAMHSGAAASISVAFDESNFSAVENPDGTTSIQFDVYQQLVDSGYITAGDPLLGGLIPPGGIAPANMGSFNSGTGTVGSITYHAKVRNQFASALGEPEVNQGDTLNNSVTISGRNLDVETLAPSGSQVTDGSSAIIEIVTGTVQKELYSTFRNGDQRFAGALDGGLEVVPGDVITWRITYDLPLSEFEGLRLEDYLPLPVFDVNDIDTSQIYAYAAPVPGNDGYLTGGRISFGPNDTFFGANGPGVTGDGGIDDAGGYAQPNTPTISLDPGNNAFIIDFGNYDITDPGAPVSTRIELFVSTVITDAVYAEGLQFTNQVGTSESNSFAATVASNEVSQIVLGVPDLSITKGVLAVDPSSGGAFEGSRGPVGVSFNAPGSATAFSGSITSDGLDANPIDADFRNLDAGDVVTFGIVVENRGSADYGAFDVEISDTIPAGFATPASLAQLNLRVTDGNGNALAYVIKGGGTTAADFFANGIELIDPGDNTGSLAEYDGGSGDNLVLVAYDLVVDVSAVPNQTLTNTATVDNFSYRNGGPNYAEATDTDTAFVTVVRPAVVKEVINTSHDAPANLDAQGEVTIGEVVTYTVTIDVPEGTFPNAVIRDTIQAGMAFVGVDSISVSPGLSTSKGAGDFSDIDVYYNAAASVLELGVGGSAGLGNLVNSNTDNAVTEQVTITYRAMVLNEAVNQAGVIRSNDAEIRWQEGGTTRIEDDTATVRVVEPNLTVSKSVLGGDLQVEGADTVTYRLVVRNTNSNGNVSEAYDVALSDLIPADVEFVSANWISGAAPDSGVVFDPGTGPEGEITATWSTFAVGAVSTIDVTVRVDDGLPTDRVIPNTANVVYSSLPGDPGDGGFTGYNPGVDAGNPAFAPSTPPVAVERTGDPLDPGGAVNDYTRSNSANVTVINPIGIDKMVVDTSENHTGADSTPGGPVQAAIGEVVRYEVRIRLPQATSTNVQLVDVLGSGLEWIDAVDNNLEIRLEGFAGDGSTLSADADIEGANGTTVALDPSRVSFNAGSNTVTFSLGNITNTETDGADEFIYIAYNAIVRNAPGVDRGDVVTNTVQLREGGANIGSALTQSITVVEPDVTLSKSDNGTTTADAGDIIDYTLTITAGTSLPQLHTTAFDLLISDVLPAGLDLVAGSVAFSGLPATSVGNVIEDTVNDSFTATVDKLEPGETFQVTFQAMVRDTGPGIIQTDETVTNSAFLTYSTLPVDGTDIGVDGNTTGNEAGTPGDTDGERITTRSNSDSFTSPVPVLAKTLANPADTTFTIGEVVEYVITLDVPEGQTGDPEAYILDVIDPGFRFVPGSLSVTTDAGIVVATGPVLNEASAGFFTHTDPGNPLAAEQIRFDFDQIVYNEGAAADGLSTGRIEIRYLLQVENTLANQQGDQLNNAADFLYTDENGVTLRTVQDATGDSDTIITIVEPQVNAAKSIAVLPALIQAGDTVSYTVTLTNPGGPLNPLQNVPAYEITAQDVVPSDLSFLGATLAADLDGTDITALITLGANGWSINEAANIDLGPGEVITITYDAVILNPVKDGDTLTNTVDVEWTSLDNDNPTDGADGADTGERSGDGDLNTDSLAGDPNDFENEATADLDINLTPAFQFEKRILSTSVADTQSNGGTNPLIEDLVVGETVTYELVATLPTGTIDSVRIYDQLALNAGLLDITNIEIQAGAALRLQSGDPLSTVIPTEIDSAAADGYTDRVEIDFGTVISDYTLATDEASRQIRILVTALVVNDIANQEGDVIANTGELRFLDDSNGDGTRTEQLINSSVSVEIVEPQIDTNKRITSILPVIEAGVTVPYEVTLSHPGDSNPLHAAIAYEVTARDVLPADLVLQTGTFTALLDDGDTLTDISALFTVDGTGWTLPASANVDLEPGDVITITYNTIVAVTVNEDDLLTNEVDVEWTSLDGVSPNERGGDGDFDTTGGTGPENDYESGDRVTIQADLAPTITKSVFSTTGTGPGNGTDPTIEDLTIGNAATYEIVISLGRGTTENVRFFDQFSIDEGILDISTVQVIPGGALSIEGGGSFPTVATVTDALGGSDGYRDTVELLFGNIVNNATGPATSAEEIRILVTAAVLNVGENQQGDMIENVASLDFEGDPDGDGTRTTETISDNAFVEIVEPQVDVVKSAVSVPAPAEAGAVISYEVTLTNPGSALTNPQQNVTAYEVTAQDVLPGGLELVPGTFQALLGAVDITASFATDETGWVTLPGADIDLAAGEVITITYDAVILETVRDGDPLTNDVDIEWTSVDGVFSTGTSGERGGNGDLDTPTELGNPNDFENSSSDTVRAELTPVFDFTKRVLTTSQASTGVLAGINATFDDLVVGETVTYELIATLGRGTTDGVRIVDQLSIANGLLDIQNVQIEGGAALSLASGSFATLTPLVTDANGGDGYQDRVEIDFGTVVNDPSLSTGPLSEQIRILVTAIVVNDLENQQGDVITNTGTFFYEDDPQGDGSRETVSLVATADVEIIEPQVNAVKVIDSIPANPQAGDTITYEVTITHPGGPLQDVTAFDLSAKDFLPDDLTLDQGSFTAVLNGLGGPVNIASEFILSDGGWITSPISNIDLAPGESITIRYDAGIDREVKDGDALSNDVDVEWTTIDGVDPGERGGDGNLTTTADPSNPNDHESGDSTTFQANLTPAFAFTKSILTSSQADTGSGAGTSPLIEDLVIGETVTYELVATMPRGTTDGVRIVDQLSIANGLLDITDIQIQGGAALSLGVGSFAGLVPLETDSVGADGYNDRVEIDFGTVINDPALVTDAASEQIRILITALVVNDIANQEGDVIRNTGTLEYLDDANGDGNRTAQTLTSSVDVELVEPEVTVTKSITNLPANPTAGERVTYQVELRNPVSLTAGDVVAYDLFARDALPANLALDELTFTAVLNGVTDVSGSFALTSSGWSLGDGLTGPSLNQGDVVLITYEAVIQPGVQDGENLLNEVDVEWSSIDGGNANERGGNGDLDSETAPGGVNDYEAADTADFDAEFTASFDFAKTILSTSESHTGSGGGTDPGIADLVIGETVTYSLKATVGRGTTDGVRFVDQLSIANGTLDITNVTINAGAALSLQSGNPFSSIVPVVSDALGGDGYRDRITVDFGTVVNNPAFSAGIEDEQIEILVTARVVNIAGNTAGDVVRNTGDFFYFDDPDGDGTQTEQSIQSSVDVEILEPNLSITKAVNNTQPRLNEVLTYTLTVTNNAGVSTTDAFDLVIDDLMDPRMTLDPASVQLLLQGAPVNPSSIVSNTSTANNLVLGIDRLDEGESIQITYEVRVSSDPADFEAVLPNDVDLHYTSTEGDSPEERGGDPLTNDPNDPDTYTDTDNESVEVFQPDLRIEKVDYDAEIFPGELITYEMTVENQGRAEARGVTVTDDISHYLEAGFTFLTGTNATLTDGIVTFVLPDMPVSDVQVITMTLQAPGVIPAALESITNLAAANHEDIDPTPLDNEDTEDTPVIARPDLVVAKDDGLLLALTGDEITYTITFRNVGDQVASGIVIEDILPPEMAFLSASHGGTLRGNSVFWEIDELPPGEVRTVEVTAEVIRPGVKLNVVTIKDDGRGGPDPTPENNRDTDETLTKWRFRYDLTQDFRTANGNLTLHEHRWGSDRILRREPVILATYMASGLAQAGSTITLEVFDERGQLIADTSVVADAGGNWLASFPMADVEKQPARIEMKQTWASYNPAGERSYNFRTYFGPAFSTGTYYTEQLTVHSVMEKRNATEVIDLYESSKMILAMDWNGQLYEFAARGALQSSSGN